MAAVEVAPSIAKFTQLPSSLQKRGKVLLNQQCWLWGQDVRRPEGNLLLERGFERLRPPEEAGGATQYTLFLTNDLRVRLWGFGMYFGGVQGVYVNRYEFVPRSASFAYEWQTAETMGSFHRCSEANFLAMAADWIADYESWVLKVAGVLHREKALSGWKNHCSTARGISKLWRSLARELRGYEQLRSLRDEGAMAGEWLPSARNSSPIDSLFQR